MVWLMVTILHMVPFDVMLKEENRTKQSKLSQSLPWTFIMENAAIIFVNANLVLIVATLCRIWSENI